MPGAQQPQAYGNGETVTGSEIPHSPEQARSYQNLEAAHKLASKKHGYDSTSVCKQLKDACCICMDGREPYKWQVDVAEAFLLGLDCLIIVGTGAGKTLPFVMPAFIEPKKTYITISPLNALEEDQVRQ